MKKQQVSSLALKKNTISNFNIEKINGGVLTGMGCNNVTYNCVDTLPTNLCERTIINCPPLTYTCYLSLRCGTM
ncbi:hypothetical protein [Kordia jejudonensis]|uniref:hypothetical protein n=1 Tax=Kordia jejudonensis TaxID=1348245 RepID=UPI0006294ED3|nr:hypothetical protein [Kordia jejudonensis]